MSVLLVAIGGALGAVVRYAVSQWQMTTAGRFPLGTCTVNLLGSLLLGWVIGAKTGEVVMLLLGVGFCGAVTTFSTLQWEIFQLHQQKATRPMLAYMLVTYGGGLVAATLGYLGGSYI